MEQFYFLVQKRIRVEGEDAAKRESVVRRRVCIPYIPPIDMVIDDFVVGQVRGQSGGLNLSIVAKPIFVESAEDMKKEVREHLKRGWAEEESAHPKKRG